MAVYAGVNVLGDRMGEAVRAQFLLANPAVIVNLENWDDMAILYGQGYRPAIHIVRHYDGNARNKAPASVLDDAYHAVPPEWWSQIHELNADNEIDIEADGRQDQPTDDYGMLGRWKLGLADAWLVMQQQHPETSHVKLQWGALTPDRMLQALQNQDIRASLQHAAYGSYGWHCYNDPNAPAPRAGIWNDYQNAINQLGIQNRTHHITEYNWSQGEGDGGFAPILEAVNGSVFQSVSWFIWFAYSGSPHNFLRIVAEDGSPQYPQVLQTLKDRAGWKPIQEKRRSLLTPLVWAAAGILGLVALKRYVED